MVNVDLNLVSSAVAEKLSEEVIGYPTENRILILSPTESEKTTDAGIIIPGAAKDDIPRKGVVIRVGEISEENITYSKIKVGDIITYGLYAGKEINIHTVHEDTLIPNGNKFTVISLNEIIYVEPNLK